MILESWAFKGPQHVRACASTDPRRARDEEALPAAGAAAALSIRPRTPSHTLASHIFNTYLVLVPTCNWQFFTLKDCSIFFILFLPYVLPYIIWRPRVGATLRSRNKVNSRRATPRHAAIFAPTQRFQQATPSKSRLPDIKTPREDPADEPQSTRKQREPKTAPAGRGHCAAHFSDPNKESAVS